MLSWWRSRKQGPGGDESTAFGRDSGTIPCIYRGEDGESVAAFSVVASTPGILPDQNPDWYFNTVITVTGPGYNPGIDSRGTVNVIGFTQVPAEDEDLVPVRFDGITLARLRIQNAEHPAAIVDENDNYKSLVSGFGGDYTILVADRRESMIGEFQNALIAIRPYRNFMLAKSETVIPSGGSGTASLWYGYAGDESLADTQEDVTVWLDWAESGESISENKEIFIQWFPEFQGWRVVGAECE
jgi:hypothetical protein